MYCCISCITVGLAVLNLSVSERQSQFVFAVLLFRCRETLQPTMLFAQKKAPLLPLMHYKYGLLHEIIKLEFHTSKFAIRANCLYSHTVQALADISRSAPCCQSNETRASIASTPNRPSAQLHTRHPDACSSVRMRRGTDRHTHTHTHRRPWPVYISPWLCLTRNVKRCKTGTLKIRERKMRNQTK